MEWDLSGTLQFLQPTPDEMFILENLSCFNQYPGNSRRARVKTRFRRALAPLCTFQDPVQGGLQRHKFYRIPCKAPGLRQEKRDACRSSIEVAANGAPGRRGVSSFEFHVPAEPVALR